jgi:hypothetical protein
MGINTRLEKMATKTAVGITITWTTNEPTASTAMTIADGNAILTTTELGIFIASQNALNAKLIADIETLRSKMNAGEGG